MSTESFVFKPVLMLVPNMARSLLPGVFNTRESRLSGVFTTRESRTHGSCFTILRNLEKYSNGLPF
jgi:hypothetical protein